MKLTCIPRACKEMDRNFIEVKTAHRGHSEGAPLSARDLSEKLVILLHDKTRHRGCLAPCDADTPVFDTVSAMRHYMINQWGSRPRDVDVLLAGGLVHGAEFARHLEAHLGRLELDEGQINDARTTPVYPIGQAPRGAPTNHLYYYPASARVELVSDPDEPGGRAYQSHHQEITMSQTA